MLPLGIDLSQSTVIHLHRRVDDAPSRIMGRASTRVRTAIEAVRRCLCSHIISRN